MKENNYAFIDGQNLYIGIKDEGWKIDYKKLVNYLINKNKFHKLLFPNYRSLSYLYKKLGNKNIDYIGKKGIKRRITIL